MITVVGALIEKDGKVLICQRGPDQTYAGQWEFPGGKVDQGESLQQALVREIHEELGVAVEAGETVAMGEFLHNADRAQMFVLRARLLEDFDSGRPLREHQAARWVDLRRLGEFPMPEADVEAFGQLIAHENKKLVEQWHRSRPLPEGQPHQSSGDHEFVEVKSLSPWSLGRLYAVLNFVVGLVMACGMLWFGSFFQMDVGVMGRLVTAATLPFINLFVGFALGVVLAWIYNVVASITGGIKFRSRG